ncbi:MAG: hypothetical protein ACK449_20235 [Planctomycetota bacterium]|jgi:uncharacterized Zn finger protein
MGQSIRFAGACPNCSRAMFVAVHPRCEVLQEPPTVKCYGCGVVWKLPSEVHNPPQMPILHPPLSSLDQRVESLLQAADEQLAPLASRPVP